MRNGCLISVVLVVVIAVLIPPILAPKFSGEGQFIYENYSRADPTISEIEAEAQALVQRGVTVVIYLVDTGNHEDLIQRLSDANLMANNRPSPAVLAIYIGMDNRYSEIGWGEIDSINIAHIRSKALNVHLRDGNFSMAIIETLHSVENRLANPYSVIIPTILYLIFDSPSWVQVGLILIMVVALIATTEKVPAGSSTAYTNNTYSRSSSSYDSGSDSSSDSGGFDGGSWDD